LDSDQANLLFQFNNFHLIALSSPYMSGRVGERRGHSTKTIHATQADRNLFQGATKTLRRKWSRIWLQGFLTQKDFEASDGEDVKILTKGPEEMEELPHGRSSCSCFGRNEGFGR